MNPRTDHVLDHVDDCVHDLLDAEGAAYVQQHCAECPTCAAALAEARSRLAALQAVPPSAAPEELVRAALAGIDEHERRQRRRRRRVFAGLVGMAAAAAVVIAGFQLHYTRMQPSAFDLKVFGQTQLLAGSRAALRVAVIKRFSDFPEVCLRHSGVPVEVVLAPRDGTAPVVLASLTTDGEGSGEPRFDVPDWADKECDLVVTAYTPEGPETTRDPVQVKRSWSVMLSSDKPVYQPGQTIHVRSLALRRPDLRPVAGQDVTFTVTDPKGNLVFKQAGKNSAYGIASADCELAAEIAEGQYVIGCTLGDTTSRLGVEVKKYVLPKFKVGLTLDRPYYAPGEKVTATVEAAYFFGKPVVGDVEMTALPAGQSKPLHQSKMKADANGRAVFLWDMPKDIAGDVSVSIRATVTDTAGQAQTKEVSAVVTTSPLRIEVFPESGRLVRGIPTTVYVFVSYADGRPAKATVETPTGTKIATNELGVGSFSFTAPNAQPLEGRFRIADEKGLTAEKRLTVACGTDPADFLLRTDKAVYSGGDTMKLSVVAHEGSPVYVDILKDGQTLLGVTIPLDGTWHGTGALDLPPELSGTMQLCAYRMTSSAIPVRKTRTLFVRPATSLQVRTTTDQPEYRPGRRAKVSFELLDRTGQPTRGALSLAVVDEAVFSVLDQAPGSEGRYFGVDEALLRPVQRLYPWSPDLKSDLPPAERAQFEQALFARTVRVSSWSESEAGSQMQDQNDEPVETPQVVASSFRAKAEQVDATRQSGLEAVRRAWSLLGLGVLVLGFVALHVFVRSDIVVSLYLVLFIICLSFITCGLWLFRSYDSLGPFAPELESYHFSGQSNCESSTAGSPADDAAKWATPGDSSVSVNETVYREVHKPRSPSPRLRRHFPETLLWRPQLITDDDGRARLDIDLADSITTWRLTASAVTPDGRLGATQAGIKVFQPFFVDLNLPVELTRGDEVAVPIVVYSYLDKPQTVELTLADGDWFERLDSAVRKIELAPRAVSSVSYRLRVKTVGKHALQVAAQGGDLSDAIRRDIEVVPDGRRVEQVANGSLAQPAEITLTVPENAIAGSPRAFVKLYPSSFSQLVEGLDGIFQMPHGCFEQTSSTTYPNVLALQYLRQSGQAAPKVKEKAERFIHLGYQRLLGFEVQGGGFDWFGHGPANLTLTAYGLMEFQDMAKVQSVDPQLIERTRAWLLKQRKRNGSWSPESHGFIGDPGQGRREDDAWLATTAYVAWAVFGGSDAGGDAATTRRYLLSHKAESMDDPYVLALVANALNAVDPEGRDARPYLERLDSLRKSTRDGRLVFWEQPAEARTVYYGAGRGGTVETTALAVLALLPHNHSPETVRRALGWLVAQKDARGTWPSTQATVLALKALIAGSATPAGNGERRIALAWNGESQEIVIPADQGEVMKQLDLSARLKPGTHRLTLTETSGTAAGYQVAFRYHVPDTARPEGSEALAVQVDYNRSDVRVDDVVTVTAKVANRQTKAAPMVVVALPIPAGFALDAAGLTALANDRKIERYQVDARSVVVYLRGLAANQSLELKYGLRATLPVKVSVPPARAYEYYDPDRQGTSRPARLTVSGR